MSSHRFIRSYGQPYFALSQASQYGMDSVSFPAFGAVGIYAEFRLNYLSPDGPSPTAVQPVISLHDRPTGGFGPVDIMAIGIAQNGSARGVITTEDGAETVIVTPPGLLAASGLWTRIYMTFDPGTGDLIFEVDGVRYTATVGGVPCRPQPGRVAMVSMHNGVLALNRSDVSIRTARLEMFGSGIETAEWLIDSRNVPVPATQSAGLALYDFSLAPGWYDPGVGYREFGDVPTAGESGAWAFEVDPAYTRIPIHRPEYRRVAVS